MKKLLLIVAAIAMMAGLAACTEPAGPEAMSAFERYTGANEALMAAGSLMMESNTTTVMEIMMEGQEPIIMETEMVATIAQVIHSETEIDMRMEMVTEMPGMGSMPSTMYFRDGVQYIEMMGQGFRMSLPLEDVLAQLESAGLLTFPEDAILLEGLDEHDGGGARISFTLAASAMQDMFDQITGSMLQNLGLGDMDIDMEFGDIEMDIELDADDMISTMDMRFTFTVEFEGEVINARMETHSEVTQIGGVTIDFPAHIDDFPEMDMSLLG